MASNMGVGAINPFEGEIIEGVYVNLSELRRDPDRSRSLCGFVPLEDFGSGTLNPEEALLANEEAGQEQEYYGIIDGPGESYHVVAAQQNVKKICRWASITFTHADGYVEVIRG